MRRCVIITAYIQTSIRDTLALDPTDLLLCADGGYVAAHTEGLQPDAILGDFDSMPALPLPSCIDVQHFPREKDETDTFLCIQYGVAHGCDAFVCVGGMGGRLDHTYANLQLLQWGLLHGYSIILADGVERVHLLGRGSLSIERAPDTVLSLFAYSPTCRISVTGVQYPLHEYPLTHQFPLGVSNRIVAEKAELCCTEGQLLVMRLREA
ncbi:MAG: thiamine diphosphokinase [Clostridia bacterium]